MKKLFCILIAAAMLCLNAAVVVVADTADIVHESVEGTAVIDGVKEEAYDNALTLDFVQKGKVNGAGGTLDESIGTAYIINDAEWVYVYFDVIDDQLDNTNANNYERDSVEAFWMDGNAKNQIRYHYAQDETGADIVDVDSGTAYESKAVLTDTGYAVEFKFPITDVRDNQIEMCLQINACSNGRRDYTCYIEGNADGDNAYQRTDRESLYDCWWTLTLAGEHEDTRVDKIDEPMVIDLTNYASLRDAEFGVTLATQEVVTWASTTLGGEQIGYLGDTLDIAWTDTELLANFTEEQTNNYTIDPKFFVQISDSGYLKMPDGAEVGDTGETARYSFTYTDITITADGYDDVVVPGDTIDVRFTVKQEDGWTSGTAVDIDLVESIKEQLGLDTQGLCEYINSVTGAATTVTFNSWNGRTKAELDEFVAQVDADDEAMLAKLTECETKITEAKAVIDDETASLEDAKTALEDVKTAYEEASEGVGDYYPKSAEKAIELESQITELETAVAELEAQAEQEAEEEAATTEPAEDPEESDDTSAPADDGSFGTTGVIVGIVIAVVVVIVIIIIAVAGGKKKKSSK